MPGTQNILEDNEYHVEIHYEAQLRDVYFDNADDDGKINDEIEWQTLISMLGFNKLVNSADTKILEKFKPSFPIRYETLLSTICQAFGDLQIKQLNEHMSDSKEQLENCRTFINLINVRSLKPSELNQLATILYSCKQKSDATEKNLMEVVEKIKSMSADSDAFVWEKLDQKHKTTNSI